MNQNEMLRFKAAVLNQLNMSTYSTAINEAGQKYRRVKMLLLSCQMPSPKWPDKAKSCLI